MATSQKKRNNRKRPPARTYSPAGRICGGIICLLLALCVIVSYCGVDAILLDFLANVLKGAFGYGYFITGPALVVAGVGLLGHKGRPVRLRTTCALLIPLLIGCLLHLFLCHAQYESGISVVKDLWSDGQLLASGGAISGGIAMGFEAVFSKVVAGIVFFVLLVVTLIGALRLSPRQMMAKAKERREYRKYQEDEGYEEYTEEKEQYIAPRVHEEKPRPMRRRRQVIDIPLDDEPAPVQKAEVKPVPEAPLTAKGKKSFFSKKSEDVRTPDEVVAPTAQETVAKKEELPKPAEPAHVAEEKSRRPKKMEMSEEELEENYQEVSAEIEQELSEDNEAYRYPPITLLDENNGDNVVEVGAELRDNSRRLAETLRSFGVDATAGDVIHGPSVTRYEFTLDQGVKLSKITNLSDDIALALGASGVRIAPIPNKISVVGIEVPNRAVTSVRIRDVIESDDFVKHPSSVAFSVGKDIGGNNIVGNIAKLPHALIAGTTGSGKSVCTNSLIISMLYKSTPDEVRFIMVDPKMVELAPYNGIPHLLIPVVTDPKKAAGALQWAVFEMMKRYKMFSEKGVKDLAGYNALSETDEEVEKLPTVVVVIDELADLMLVAAKEVEESICRVAQMGRAAGMHLVIATQRPSSDVITGLMKANIPSRIAFAVASSLESRIILDTTGAEKLVGKGDMLYFPLGMQKPLRVQGCFITPEEIDRVVRFVKDSGEANYDQSVMDKIDEALKKDEKGKPSNGGGDAPQEKCDEMLPAAVDVILETGQASVSMLQRRLKLGYARAARLVDQMEDRGIVGPFEGSKPRQLLITREQWQEMQMKGTFNAAEEPEEKEIDRYGSISDVFESHDALD